jgi:hypothetical protein
VTQPIIFRSYGACPNYAGASFYKHFVPTGLRPISSKLFCYHGQKQRTNGASPALEE